MNNCNIFIHSNCFKPLLWSQKVGSHFADSNQVKNLVVILLTLNKPRNLVVILLLIVGHGCFLDMGWQFWNAFFEGGVLKYTHVLSCFLRVFFECYGCSCVFEKFPTKVRKNKNTQAIFNIFNILFPLLI